MNDELDRAVEFITSLPSFKRSAQQSEPDVERLAIPEYTQGVCYDGAAILMDGRPLTPDEIVQLLNANERLLHERQKVLDAIPECGQHGMNCVPHALEWIKARV